MAKRNAFTLAEVLITLGIIGVVAAMTLPTLLTSTQAAQFRAQVKKTLAVSSQAIVVNLAMDDFDAGTTTTTAYGHDDDVPNASLVNIFSDRLQVLNKGGANAGADWTGVNNTSNYTLFLNDGSVISFPNTCQANSETSPCKGVIDVNGRKKPNLVVACETASQTDSNCKVKKAYDQYPIHIYDQTIRPGNVGARYVIFKAGK